MLGHPREPIVNNYWMETSSEEGDLIRDWCQGNGELSLVIGKPDVDTAHSILISSSYNPKSRFISPVTGSNAYILLKGRVSEQVIKLPHNQ